MTQARKHIKDPNHAGTYHCVARCVRRSWLCGVDVYTQKSFEHRKPWVENRISELAEIFACSVLAYAVMSNHFHLVVSMCPDVPKHWSAREVAERWCRLYPKNLAREHQTKIAAIEVDPEKVEVYRARMHDLSWLMKLLNEPIARRANAEDKLTGKFWESRFKCQLLQSEKSILAVMTYVDLNPVRAKIANTVSTSKYTSVRQRSRLVRGDPNAADKPLRPLIGCMSYNLPSLSEGDYLDLVDYTRREIYSGKRGKIAPAQPRALNNLALNPNHWVHRVKGFGNGFGAKWFRVVGELEEMIEKAKAINQRTLFGVGLARNVTTR